MLVDLARYVRHLPSVLRKLAVLHRHGPVPPSGATTGTAIATCTRRSTHARRRRGSKPFSRR